MNEDEEVNYEACDKVLNIYNYIDSKMESHNKGIVSAVLTLAIIQMDIDKY